MDDLLFTPFYRNFPLADSYFVSWEYNVKTPVLFPGLDKCQQDKSYQNPARIINSYLRSVAKRFQDTDIREPYNLRPLKVPVKKGKKYRTLFTLRRSLFVCNPADQIKVTEFDSSVLFSKNSLESEKVNERTDNIPKQDIIAHESDSDVSQKEDLGYESDETFIYFDDPNCQLSQSSDTSDNEDGYFSEIDVNANEHLSQSSDTSEHDDENKEVVIGTVYLQETISVEFRLTKQCKMEKEKEKKT